MMDDVRERVRLIVAEHASLAVDAGSISDEDDLYRLGMTSHANVNVMLALEDCFDVEFPESMLRRSTFQSVRAIGQAVCDLVTGQIPA